MFRAVLPDAKLFKAFTQVISKLTQDVAIEASEGGIVFRGVDVSMTAYMFAEFPAKAFDSYEFKPLSEESPTIAFGIDTTRFHRYLSLAKAKDSIELSLEKRANRYVLAITLFRGTIENKDLARTFRIPLMDVPDIRPFDRDKFEEVITAKFRMSPPTVLQEILKSCRKVSDDFTLKVEDDKFIFRAENEYWDEYVFELPFTDDSIVDYEVKERPVEGLYATDQVLKMMPLARVSDVVEIAFGNKMPLRVTFRAGPAIRIEFYVAHRIT